MIEGSLKFCPLCGAQLTERQHSGRLRPACPKCGWVYFPDPKVAVAVLIRENDKVLLVQRRYDPHQGDWTLPSGFVDAGEDPKAAAARECLEETGLIIDSPQLLDVIYGQEHPHGASIIIVYSAQVLSGKLTPDDDAKQAVYFPLNNLPPLAFLSTQHILDLYF